MPLTVVPLVLPRSRTIQIPFKNLSVAVLARNVLVIETDVAAGPAADHHLGLRERDRVAAANGMQDPEDLVKGAAWLYPRSPRSAVSERSRDDSRSDCTSILPNPRAGLSRAVRSRVLDVSSDFLSGVLASTPGFG